MNYLAHIYLARENPGWMTGSFIADGFKGASYKTLPSAIIQGVELHRAVDSYTDTHTNIRILIKHLSELLGRYSPVAIDVFGDYYLASHFNTYSDTTLKVFEQYAYSSLQSYINYIPLRYKRMVQAIGYKGMLQQYANTNSLEYVFKRLQKRIQYDNKLDKAVNVLQEEQDIIFKHFNAFFPELLRYAEEYKRSYLSDK